MTDQQQERPKRELVPLEAGGQLSALIPQSLDEAYRLSQYLAESGLTPRGIKTPPQVFMVISGGAEVGFGPFQSLQAFCLINGRLSMWGDAIPALLWSRGFDIEESWENEDPELPDNMTAVCTITRPNGRVITRRFSVADAKRAKLWNKKGHEGQDTPWITYPQRMLQMRARGFAVKDGAPDVTRGIVLREEAQDMDVIESTATVVEPQPLHGGFEDQEKPKRQRKPKADPKPEPQPEEDDGAEFTEVKGEDTPARDEVYFHTDADAVNDQGRRISFKNGERFSTAAANNPDILTYAQHAPIVVSQDEEDAGEEENPTSPEADTETDGAPDAESEPDTSDSATDASQGSLTLEEDSGQSTLEAGDGLPAELSKFVDDLEATRDFGDVKACLAAFQKTALWEGMDEAQRNEIRANTWNTIADEDSKFPPDQVPDPFANISAFRMWIETREDPEDVELGLSQLENSATFKQASDGMKENVRGAVAARLKALEEADG